MIRCKDTHFLSQALPLIVISGEQIVIFSVFALERGGVGRGKGLEAQRAQVI